MKQGFPYIIIGILLTIVALQWKQCVTPQKEIVVTKDTVVKVIEIREQRAPSETLFIASTRDTMWKESIIYVPDSTYKGLLRQYEALGNQLFATNYFQSKFDVADYGHVIISDTIKANRLAGTGIQTFLDIPERTITIEKTLPPMNEFYLGGGLTGASTTSLNGLYFGGILKDKKQRMFGINVGYTHPIGITYGVSYYSKLGK